MANASMKNFEIILFPDQKNYLVNTLFFYLLLHMIISRDELASFVAAKNSAPHDLLGIHEVSSNDGSTGMVIRAYLQNAQSCQVLNLDSGQSQELEKIHETGFFEVFIKNTKNPFRYKLQITTKEGRYYECFDPYTFLPTLSDLDTHLFNEGNHHKIYEKLGAHLITHQGVLGTSFALWAPNARRVSIVGDFNNWDGRYNPMRPIGLSGIWEIFLPTNLENFRYKYEILCRDGSLVLKTDPYGNFFEPPPNNASIVTQLYDYKWNDSEWLFLRAATDFKKNKISIYEVHLDSWKRVLEENHRPLTYREIAIQLCTYVKSLGFSHIELMPITEYPYLGSWGYQVTGFFAPTCRYGNPKDFMFLVDHFHQNGIGVIMDWVPGHFPKDSFALANFDGTCLYEHSDPKQGIHQDWDTLIFNYERHEVRNFLTGSALFWLDKFHIDGLRVDAVASMLYLDYSRNPGEWVPNRYGGHENIAAIEFLRETNNLIHNNFPGVISIAEESTSFGGVTRPTEFHGLGFDLKWNMGWMHDTINYFSKDPIFRKHHHNELTFGILYQYSENFILAFSHDEVVHGKKAMIHKMPGYNMTEKANHLRSLYGLMFAWPGKKCLFMGCEFGQSSEWNYRQSLDWHLLQYQDHSGIQALIESLNTIYTNYPFLAKGDFSCHGFEWLVVDDHNNSVLSFLRKGTVDEFMLVVCNLTPVTRTGYRIGVPKNGRWLEILNTDSSIFGGTNVGNLGFSETVAIGSHKYKQSVELTLAPTSTMYFIFQPQTLIGQ
ncbi:MAG: 1,4-alpha-glucan branching protein GlgB [Puniceicoccales bacterium]|jgi:1,4-alpha-glucan branching enzyme|nr:1,4-alpha-glucan branching protein GlgB [Puniceicoccales bacterium]